MSRQVSGQEQIYCIKVKEALDHTITDWFGALTVISLETGETLMFSPIIDQVALRGLLENLWNLNFTILSVQRIENEN